MCKTLSQLLKTYQHPPPSGNKVSSFKNIQTLIVNILHPNHKNEILTDLLLNCHTLDCNLHTNLCTLLFLYFTLLLYIVMPV